MDLNLDDVLSQIEKGDIIEESIVVSILMKIMEILYLEGNVLLLQSPIIICGDIHGQLDDLLELFRISGNKENQSYLFMGDYVDRGYHSLDTFLYLICLKLKYPNQFHLLRGNHESRQVSQMYGFYNECILNYGHAGIWQMCNETFDLLPLAAVIDKDIFSVHGGLSPELPLIEMIALLDRQVELPANGSMCDLCWSDPEEVPQWHHNQRGAGYLFGENEVKKFNHQNKLKLITRSHQLAMEGYRYLFPDPQIPNHKGRLVTIWSAPNYSYRSGNDASVMKLRFPGLDEYHLSIFQPAVNRIVPKDIPTATSYFA